MKLTKQQRHMAYLIMLASFEDSECEYLCHSFENDGIVNFGNRFEFLLSLTELAKKRTEDYVWFSKGCNYSREANRSIRISVLKQCIEETADAWPK